MLRALRAHFLPGRTLVLAFVVSVAILIVIVITEGFVVRVGALRVSVRRPANPLIVCGLATTGLLALGRDRRRAAGAWLTATIERDAGTIAFVLAAATAGVGIGAGTYAAGGADSSGYISQASLVAAGRLAREEPLAAEVGWPDADWAFASLGYRPGARLGEVVPTYPAGLPLAMAAAMRLGGEWTVYLIVPLLAAVVVACTFRLASNLHSRFAGLVAATFAATSPILLFQAVQPMSDVPAAAWWLVAVVLALQRGRLSAAGSGLAAGMAILTRPNLLPLMGLVVLAAVGTFRSDRRTPRSPVTRLAFVALGAAPGVATLLLLQWQLYGSPFSSGYGDLGPLFSVSNIAPNVRGYASRLLVGETAVLVVVAIAGVILFTRRAPGDRRIAPALTMALCALGIVLACYLPYVVFPEWFYLRFLLPALPFVFAGVGAIAAAALLHVPVAARGTALIAILTLAGSLNVRAAEREQAFALRIFEARYRQAGLYLASTLPRTAVVITMQHSGSVRYYTGLPIVRWDRLGRDLDAVVVALRASGRQPYLLIEDWESVQLLERFPASTAARLDWPPRAEFGATTLVRLYDPVDRDAHRAGRAWRIDRVR